MKETDRIVVAKPVPSRPTCSSFRSFSELLAGAINASPPNVCTETAVPAIRPKTVRFKPAANRNPIGVVSSQADIPGTAGTSTGEASKSESKPTVIYKPLAKLVSRSTVSLLANMGSFNPGIQQPPSSAASTYVPHQTDERYNSRPQHGVNYHQSTPSRAETNQTSEPLKSASQTMEEDPKPTPPMLSGDRPSYDGYNWRKYGQKQVKGSEFPRSYYKCTHPNCPVKKKVERSLDGQIAEIVYKGEHNHPKPQPPKRSSSGTNQGLGVADGAVQDTNTPLSIGHLQDRNEGSEGRVENNQNEASQAAFQGKMALAFDPVTSGTVNPQGGTPDNSCGLSGECEGGGNAMEMEEDEPKSKRRKNDVQSNEAGTSGEGAQDGRASVQNSTDVDVIGDGFRWRKYGQKVVKGNPYPRSYYRCTGLKCNVRKYVERASDDPRAFITTYEGKHNHEMPLRTANSAASETDPQAGTSKNKQ